MLKGAIRIGCGAEVTQSVTGSSPGLCSKAGRQHAEITRVSPFRISLVSREKKGSQNGTHLYGPRPPSANRRRVLWSRIMLLSMQPDVLGNTLKEKQPMSANGAKVPRRHAESAGRPKSPRVGRSQRREGQPSLPCSTTRSNKVLGGRGQQVFLLRGTHELVFWVR